MEKNLNDESRNYLLRHRNTMGGSAQSKIHHHHQHQQQYRPVLLKNEQDDDDDHDNNIDDNNIDIRLSQIQKSSSSSSPLSLLSGKDDDDDDDSEDDYLIPPGGVEDEAAAVAGPPPGEVEVKSESFLSITLQIFFPFLLAGLGMVGAGLVLDIVQHWEVFEEISEIFILVPALLGLKGNLEMTLASRLSTQAHLGKMDSQSGARGLIIGNLALVQCQGIVVGFVASLFAVTMGWISAETDGFSIKHGLLLCASSVLTASIASFVLGLVMVVVIMISRKYRINPDNVATPIGTQLFT